MDAEQLLSALADGEFHSGEVLAARSGMTRAAVWKSMKKLSRWGLAVESVSGRGYRLSEPVELLNADVLRNSLVEDAHFVLDRLDVFTEIDSTNAWLLANPPAAADALRVCIAEWQSAGRGRLERRWSSPLGSGLCLSAAWTYVGSPGDLSTVSLASGVVVAQAIQSVCGVSTTLKWPNDVVWDERKLGGILVESRFEAQGRCTVVIGVGLNVALPQALLSELSDWPGGAVDLRTANAGRVPGRMALASALVRGFGGMLADLQTTGTRAWLERWRVLDFLRGQAVSVHSQAGTLEGLASGIAEDGALLVSVGEHVQRVVAGDARVRRQ